MKDTTMASEHQQLAALQRRVDDLAQVCAEAYQFAGAVGAPERVLDNLLAGAEGQPIPHASILPVLAEECDAVSELRSKLEQVRHAVGPVEGPKVVNLMTALRKSMTTMHRRATPKKPAKQAKG